MILGLTGKKQVGKNTVAKALAAHAPVVEVSFAAKLKESAAAVLGVPVDTLERWKNDPHALVAIGLEVECGDFIAAKTQSVRGFLQRYGTEGHRDVFGPDMWIDAALPVDRDYTTALYVVTDVRFENEARRVKELGGHIARVIGPAEIELAGDGHASERPLEDALVDFEFNNSRRDDSFASLDIQARKLLRVLGVSDERTVGSTEL